MIRVLHVHDRDADLQTRASLAALRDAPNGDIQQTTRTIGRGGDYGNLFWAVVGLGRLVQRVDVCHAWDERSFTALSYAGAKRILFTLPPHLPRRGNGLRKTGVALVCTSAAQRRACLSAGMPPERCHFIRPPLPDIPTDRSIRQRLGLRQGDLVMLTSGESSRQAAHERAVWAGSILHVTDERYRVLLWGHGSRLAVAAGLGDKLRQNGLVIVAERKLGRAVPFEELLPAADALLVTATGSIPALPVAMAMAAGVPVVAAERPELSELLTDTVTALTVPTCTPRLLAQRVLDVQGDAGDLTAAARERVSRLFSTETFRANHAALYERVAEITGPLKRSLRESMGAGKLV